MRRAALLLVVAVLAGGCSDKKPTTEASCASLGADGKGFDCPVKGDEVPDLAFTRFDGSTASLRDYDGTALLVNFFASTCLPCRREMPGIEALSHQYADELRVLGLAVNDRLEDAQQLVEDTGVTYDLGLDPKSEVLLRLGGVALPTTVLISSDGVVVGMHTGDLKQDALQKFIEDRLHPG